MELFYSDTLNPRKVCAVARYLESPLKFVSVDLPRGEHKTEAYLAMNPNGKVPVLRDGDRVVWESNAIMCYLAAKAGSNLWPSGERQIEALRWLFWDAQHFSRHASRLYFEYIIKPKFLQQMTPDLREVDDALKYFRVFAEVLDRQLADRPYVLGEAVSVADFALGVTLPYAERTHIPVDEFPNITAWHGRLNQLPGWRNPFPA